MLTNTPCVHLTECACFAGIHLFAIQLNEYKQLQNTAAMNNLNPSLSANHVGTKDFSSLCSFNQGRMSMPEINLGGV